MPTDFPPDVVAAVCRHMDEDHPDDALLIVRTLGGVPDATAVRTTAVDGAGLRFVAERPTGPVEVAVPFEREISTRPEIREQVVRLHERASAQGAGG